MLTDEPIFQLGSLICCRNTKAARQCGSRGCCSVGLQYHYIERWQEQNSHYVPSSQCGQRRTPQDLTVVIYWGQTAAGSCSPRAKMSTRSLRLKVHQVNGQDGNF